MLTLHSFLQSVFLFVKSLAVKVKKEQYRTSSVMMAGAVVIAVVAFGASGFGGSGKNALAAPRIQESTEESEEPEEEVKEEVTVLPNIQEIVDDIIEHTIGNQNIEEMSRDQKIDLIRFMNDKGLFLIKGAADKVAERMNISKVTVYSYLDEIRKAK